MKKPNDYENAQTTQEFIPVELGGHLGIIKNVEERKTRTGKDMIVVYIDFDSSDKQPGYFQRMYNNDDRSEKKWPFQAIQYIVATDNAGKCSTSFKGFCEAFEKSNSVAVAWTDGASWTDQFKRKRIGVVFGEVEEEYNGEVRTRRRIRWFCEYGKAAAQRIPTKKELKRTDNGSEFMPIPDTEDLPW